MEDCFYSADSRSSIGMFYFCTPQWTNLHNFLQCSLYRFSADVWSSYICLILWFLLTTVFKAIWMTVSAVMWLNNFGLFCAFLHAMSVPNWAINTQDVALWIHYSSYWLIDVVFFSKGHLLCLPPFGGCFVSGCQMSVEVFHLSVICGIFSTLVITKRNGHQHFVYDIFWINSMATVENCILAFIVDWEPSSYCS